MAAQAFADDSRSLTSDGAWFRDPQGRYCLFRGINLGSRSKVAPFLPIYPLARGDFDAQAFASELKSMRGALDGLQTVFGFNFVRLLVPWKALEPELRPDGQGLSAPVQEYVGALKAILDELHQRGMVALIDLHQDIAHESFGGEGVPDWAVYDDGFGTPPSARPGAGRQWAASYVLNHGVRWTLRSLWNNSLQSVRRGLHSFPVRNHLLRSLRLIAAELKGHPAVLGYEPINEPHPVGLDRRDFESTLLKHLYEGAEKELRSAGETGFLFVEPRVDWNVFGFDTDEKAAFIGFTKRPETALDTSNLSPHRTVFSFHHYDPWTLGYGTSGLADSMANKAREWPAVFDQMVDAARTRHLIPFMTEFGAHQGWEGGPFGTGETSQAAVYMELAFEQVERHLLNAAYWNADFYNDATDGDRWNFENFSLLGPGRTPRRERIAARPYPVRSSAKPTLLSFHPNTSHAVMVFEGEPTSAPSSIFLPASVHYPDGFEVRASAGELSWNAGTSLLEWKPAPGPAHVLAIAPKGRFNADALGAIERSALAGATHKQELGVPPANVA